MGGRVDMQKVIGYGEESSEEAEMVSDFFLAAMWMRREQLVSLAKPVSPVR